MKRKINPEPKYEVDLGEKSGRMAKLAGSKWENRHGNIAGLFEESYGQAYLNF